ncbi:MFS transporter [Streptomyces sp. Wb2n-11]|uniref:MFS transporter n=1 Tax=Streptomyces sp. Wb2n-11 TaxID=1030533 RepID=UPI0021000C40|nr:MFS transporter [Streptomyces sp. Wb2n-11]
MIPGVICLAQLTVLLDNTVLNVAIPSLTEEPDASTADIQWMINAYSLVQSGLLLTAGSAADRYGRKKMLVTGLALFGVGSPVAGLARSSARLITARATIASGMTLLSAGLAAIAVLGGGTGSGHGGMLLGLVVMGAGISLAMPAMANAIMSAIPPEKAGVGAGVNGTPAEFGNGPGVAVLGAVLNSRFAALVPAAASLPAALAAADGAEERARIADAFASGVETSQLVGAVLLRRAERADSSGAASAA